ncbi:MAG TPA: sialidase family protein [Acidimicrobiales bacterium]|nr:sialidase family protein [Acidimicrobiales bacterium]
MNSAEPESREPQPGGGASQGGRRRRGGGIRVFLGLALVALGAGSALVASSLDEASARVVGRNVPISAQATDLRIIDANNSPTVVRSPTDANQLAVVNRIDTPRFSCDMHASFDAGATWQPVEIPFPEGEELPPRCFAPDAAFGADGTLYVSFVTLIGLGNTPNAAWVATARAGESVLSKPQRALGPLAFQVRVATDPARAGRLWLSYVNVVETATLGIAAPGNPVQVVASDDGGATWTEPVKVSDPARQRVIAPSIASAPGGRLYALYLDLGDDALDYSGAHEGRGGDPYAGTWSLVLARSGDGGRTWREAVVDDKVVPTERIIVLFPPSPSLAVDQKGDKVYVAFTDGRDGDADVRVWASENGGAGFGPGRRVNDTAAGDDTAQYLPRLAVAPNGRVDILYFDRRADPKNVMNHVSLQWSTDSGRSWRPRLRLSDRAFDSRIGFGSERGLPDLGSRLGLVSTEQRALAIWTDTRAGTEASNKQDMARAVAAFTEESELRDPLRAGGVGVGAFGVILLVSGLFRRPRRGPSSPAE